ncbi:hypothetical protein JT207_04030, partial [Helicobacter pylori]|nr:hypothetical protein [Helicobacter pylori]
VRDLRRQIATIMRKVALKYLEDNPHKKGRTKKSENEKSENEKGENKDFCVSITPNNLKEYLECMVFEIDPID